MSSSIVPAILVETFEELKRQIQKVDGLFTYVQIDIMDGNFVHNRSFREVERIKEIGTELKYELHLMVNDPVMEMKKWIGVENVFRVIAHIESPLDIEKSWEFAKQQGWEFGIALNPDTKLEVLNPHLDCIDLVLFMTVYPGRQGNKFEEKVLPKIAEYLKLEKRPLCAVDGGINLQTIEKFKNLPIDIFYVGSALLMAPEIEKSYVELREKI